MKYLLFLFPIFLQAQCLIETHSYRLICADEVRYADSISSGSRLYISSRNAFVTSPRSVFSLVNGYGQHFIQITNSANSQKVAINRAWINRIDSTSGNKALIYIKDISVTFTTTESYTAVKDSAIACFIRSVASGLATLSDGDYGDVVVSGGGLVMTVDKPDLGLHNLADGDFSVVADSTALSLTNVRSITLTTKNIDNWIARYLQTNTSITLRAASNTKTSRIFVDTTGANFQFINGANNASLLIGDSVAVRFNTSGSVGDVLTVTSVDGDGRLVINPKEGGSGTANCEQTLTKNSHGFSKWTPIYWNGSAWARPTFDSIIPTYIVIDSTTVNTFKVANCGNYSSTLTAGLYYYKGASPGYSLTPTSIPTPLFEVAQSRLILQPLVGFNLSGGSGSGDVTSAVLADTAAAIRADFPNGIISALPNDSVGITSMHPLRISNPNGFVQIKDGKFIANWKSDNVIISAYNNRPIIDDGAAVSVGCCEDSIMYGGVLVGMYSSLKKGGVGHFSTVVGYNSEADSTIKYTLVGTKNRVFGVRSDAALLGNYIDSYGSYVFGVGQSLRFNHNYSGLFGYGMATDKINQFKYGIQTRQVQHDFLGNLAIFDSTRTAASFVHDSRKDTTLIHGTAVFGKPSSLGSPTDTGYSHIFRHPSTSSTAVLIESGRTSPTGGTAGIRMLPSGLWSAQIEYGSATSNALSFYSHRLGRNTLFLGSSGFVAGSPRTIIVGYSDDPGQWSGNAAFVVYDTITSGKALAVFKKITSSSTHIATFSSASNDRMTIEDDGDVKVGTGAASAKLHVAGDCIVESTLWLNLAKTVGIFSGTGTPEGVVTASVGSTFHRTNGGALTSYYVKESGTGNTGWVAK